LHHQYLINIKGYTSAILSVFHCVLFRNQYLVRQLLLLRGTITLSGPLCMAAHPPWQFLHQWNDRW